MQTRIGAALRNRGFEATNEDNEGMLLEFKTKKRRKKRRG